MYIYFLYFGHGLYHSATTSKWYQGSSMILGSCDLLLFTNMQTSPFNELFLFPVASFLKQNKRTDKMTRFVVCSTNPAHLFHHSHIIISLLASLSSLDLICLHSSIPTHCFRPLLQLCSHLGVSCYKRGLFMYQALPFSPKI